ncbi:hypothetical protein EVA_14640, partial [gut metagenome]
MKLAMICFSLTGWERASQLAEYFKK